MNHRITPVLLFSTALCACATADDEPVLGSTTMPLSASYILACNGGLPTDFASTVASLGDSVVHENAMKWYSQERQDGKTYFRAADAMLAEVAARARAAEPALARVKPAVKTAALKAAAAAMRDAAPAILAANAKDMAAGEAKGLTGAMLDRLKLDEGRLDGVAGGPV